MRYYEESSAKDSLANYPGPFYEDLDERFQDKFERLLSDFGINSELCLFIERFAADKENREYIRWLNNLQQFVSKN